MVEIELNPKFVTALDIMENSTANLFLTGRAGTGKSTLLNYFKKNTKKNVVVLAPTGVAAINVRGETIHSFFMFRPDITAQKIKKIKGSKADVYKKVDTIVIDEISMVRADLLDCVDKFLRLNGKKEGAPFGGLQMVFIGDLYQLPPVLKAEEKLIFQTYYQSAYFFEADAFKGLEMEFVELEKIYRQKDRSFIDLLNSIRNNTLTDEQLALINNRAVFSHGAQANKKYSVYLTTTNKMAQSINERYLRDLSSRTFRFRGEVIGEFNQSSYPADLELNVKAGSQIMLLNNDSKRRWVNGSIGVIANIKFDPSTGCDVITVELENKNKVDVAPYTWEIYHFFYNKNNNSLDTDVVGSFTQYPIKLAWAVTIHKSQGKTFDNVVIDMGSGAFAHGQTYVALSRCRSLEGISLARPIRKSDVFTDFRVDKFITDNIVK